MTKQFLHGENTGTRTEEMHGERVTQRPRRDSARQARAPSRVGHRALKRRSRNMASAPLARRPMHVLARRRK